MNFDIIILNQSINTVQSYATRIQIVSLFISKLKMFIKTSQMMLKKDLIHQVIKYIGICLQENMKKDLSKES